jgi:ATP-dependent 26S proteasome regulatory subunit
MGKSQLARYIAQQSGCPFLQTSAPGFMSNKENSGAETVARLFNRSRIRPLWSSFVLNMRKVLAFLLRRPMPHGKPTIVLVDEVDAIAQAACSRVRKGDSILERERSKTLKRFYWEVRYNRYIPEYELHYLNECPPATTLERLYATVFNTVLDKSCCPLSQTLAALKKDILIRKLAHFPKSETLVIATTNIPIKLLDPGISTFFEIIDFGKLDAAQHCRAITEFHAQGKVFQSSDLIDRIAERLRDAPVADIASVVNDAALFAAARTRQGPVVISQDDVDRAFTMLPS